MKKAIVLNTDVLSNVLALLPAKNLTKLKIVSKAWLNLISDPTFMRAHSQKTKLVFSGFLFQQKFRLCESDIERISYISVESKGTTLQRGPFSFLHEHVVLLGSCNGLICCRSCLPSQNPAIYVCNPLIKDWIKFEWHCANWSDGIGFACDLSGSVISSTNFKVVVVKQQEDTMMQSYFSFDIYSTEIPKWKRSSEICRSDCKLTDKRALYVGGILHWMTDNDHILTFNPETNVPYLVSVPVLPAVGFQAPPQACLGEHEGVLHYVMITKQGLLVWLLEDVYNSQWTLECSKSLNEIQHLLPEGRYNLRNALMMTAWNPDPCIEALSFKDRHLLFRVFSTFFLFDMEGNVIEEVCDVTELCTESMYNPIVVPYSMSLIPLNDAELNDACCHGKRKRKNKKKPNRCNPS